MDEQKWDLELSGHGRLGAKFTPVYNVRVSKLGPRARRMVLGKKVRGDDCYLASFDVPADIEGVRELMLVKKGLDWRLTARKFTLPELLIVPNDRA